jgi:hypothetical protein
MLPLFYSCDGVYCTSLLVTLAVRSSTVGRIADEQPSIDPVDTKPK